MGPVIFITGNKHGEERALHYTTASMGPVIFITGNAIRGQ